MLDNQLVSWLATRIESREILNLLLDLPEEMIVGDAVDAIRDCYLARRRYAVPSCCRAAVPPRRPATALLQPQIIIGSRINIESWGADIRLPYTPYAP